MTFALLSLRLNKYAPELEGDHAGTKTLKGARLGSGLALVGALLGGVACFYFAFEPESGWRAEGPHLGGLLASLPHAMYWLLLCVKAPQLSSGKSRRREQVSALFSGTLICSAVPVVMMFLGVMMLLLGARPIKLEFAALFIGVFGLVRVSRAYRLGSSGRTRKVEGAPGPDSESAHPSNMRPAGFWIRWAAQFIDFVIFLIAYFGLAFVLAALVALLDGPSLYVVAIAVGVSFLSLSFLYETMLTASKKQGTLGKQALSIKVTTQDGERLSFKHSVGRYFSKASLGPAQVVVCFGLLFSFDTSLIEFGLNTLFTLGCILAAFMPRKRALQDLLAKTYVVHGGRSRNRPARNRRGVKVKASGSAEAGEVSP